MAIKITESNSALTLGFAAVSRAVVSAAADLVTRVQGAVVGTANLRTARSNAWEAILADRARTAAREDLNREVAALVAAGHQRGSAAGHQRQAAGFQRGDAVDQQYGRTLASTH